MTEMFGAVIAAIVLTLLVMGVLTWFLLVVIRQGTKDLVPALIGLLLGAGVIALVWEFVNMVGG